MYMALATAKQFASFVVLCGILELIVGIWSRFDVFVPIDMRYNVSRTDVHLYARQVGLCLLYVDNYCGHTVKVRRFRAYICDNMSWTYVYVFARQTMLPL